MQTTDKKDFLDSEETKQKMLKLQQESAPWAFNTDNFIQTKVGEDGLDDSSEK